MNAATVQDPAPPGILVIDDEADIRSGIRALLEGAGYASVQCCGDGREAAAFIGDPAWPVAICDVDLPGESGLGLLERMSRAAHRHTTIMVSGLDELDIAVRCIRSGAQDYLLKPVQPGRLLQAVDQAVQARGRAGACSRMAAFGIISGHPGMQALFTYLQAIAGSTEPVLISGETGTGKECFARAVHDCSARSGPFVAVNVASLDEQLFADALFGHGHGAYTGADRRRPGLIEQAADGTLFLDEIGDLAPAAQAALLRLLQEGEYYPLGQDRPRRSRARIVVASNRPLRELGDRFRSDLYFRLRVHHIDLPPLRERGSDILLLLDHFLRECAAPGTPPPVDEALRRRLLAHPFPGNVRELRALVVDACTRHRHGLDPRDAFIDLLAEPSPITAQPGVDAAGPLPTIAEATDAL
ncbi:MAG: sigma-54-dependent transcriptional regulator, partial [Planctomycetota bacterium]